MRNDPYADHSKEFKTMQRKGIAAFFLIVLPIVWISMYLYNKYCYETIKTWLDKDMNDVVHLVIVLLLVSLLSTVGIAVTDMIFNIRKSNLKHAIVSKVKKGVNINLLDKDNEALTLFNQADDKKLVLTRGVPMLFLTMYGVLFLIPAAIFGYHLYIERVSTYHGDHLYLATAILFFYVFVHNLIMPYRHIVFNRLDGTVSAYGFMLPWHQTVPFHKVRVNAYPEQFHLIMPYRAKYLNLLGSKNDLEGWWSFYVWYMDKNRPLPQGSLLEAYREDDYLRRRAEGFPPPLHPATIPTPEWKQAVTKYNDTEAELRYMPNVCDEEV